MGKDGQKKLGKRDGAKDSLEYREEGYLPEALVNFLALLGWHPTDDREIFTIQELIEIFEMERIQKAGAQWNDEKLNWINREYLKKLSTKEQSEYVEKFIPINIKSLPEYSLEIIQKISPIIMERISCGKDIVDMALNGDLIYYFTEPNYQKDVLFFKSSKIPLDDKYKVLSSYIEKSISLISNIKEENFNRDIIKDSLWPYAEEVGRGDILWPMRYALSGVDKSPDPFILAEILGKKETIERLNYAIKILKI
jgi:glutamyl/glutaminyl-tRNA synthetase